MMHLDHALCADVSRDSVPTYECLGVWLGIGDSGRRTGKYDERGKGQAGGHGLWRGAGHMGQRQETHGGQDTNMTSAEETLCASLSDPC